MSNQDYATKNCVDTNALIRACGTVFGPILLNVSSNNPTVFLGCPSLDIGKAFYICWGQTKIHYRIPYSIQEYQLS